MTARFTFDVPLAPVLGSTFQPTGFPDIGAATFTRFEDGKEVPALLVESAQSMANHLEGGAWDGAAEEPVGEIAGLPYVRVVREETGEFLTSSRLEAHRLASPFVFEAKLNGTLMFDVLKDRLGLAPDTPHDRRAQARAVAKLDPFCLLHGVFFSRKEWLGQPKFERAISAVVEAWDVRPAVSGGRKADHVRHQLGDVAGGTAEGYGSVPFHRTDWTASRIIASFVVDRRLIRAYGLPDPATELLETLALWEIRTFLESGLRLRTACDLETAGPISSRHDSELPSLTELADRLPGLIKESGDAFGEGAPITVEWADKNRKKG